VTPLSLVNISGSDSVVAVGGWQFMYSHVTKGKDPRFNCWTPYFVLFSQSEWEEILNCIRWWFQILGLLLDHHVTTDIRSLLTQTTVKAVNVFYIELKTAKTCH
jgi:hypothetical protein